MTNSKKKKISSILSMHKQVNW